jgi:hypothetical protein
MESLTYTPEVTSTILPAEPNRIGEPRANSSLVSWQHFVVFLASALIVISHRPDAVLHPQFWGEDGATFYADAHNLGAWSVLFHPYAGYLHIVPRLVAAIAQMLPLAAAPLFFNLVAILVQVLPVNFFLSSRFTSLATMPTRLLLSFLYLALPNYSEIDANLTNAQWHLALLLCLTFMAVPARSLLWRCFDFVAVILGSLTGPFSIFLLLPASIAWTWKRRSRWPLALLVTFAICGLTQLLTLARIGSVERGHGRLMASPLLFAKILASQVFVGSVVGRNIVYSSESCAELITIAGIFVFVYVLWNSRWEIKFFIVFACIVLAASLSDPKVNAPKWPLLMISWGSRYWYFPILAFVAALVWMAGNATPRFLKFAAVFILLVMSSGVIREWRYRPFADLHFTGYAQEYSSLPAGAKLVIPLNPPKFGWSMTLDKR